MLWFISSLPVDFFRDRDRDRSRLHPVAACVGTKAAGESGQATAEYGLVMLAAAAIAGLLLAWATGTDAIGRIMDAVVSSIIGDIG